MATEDLLSLRHADNELSRPPTLNKRCWMGQLFAKIRRLVADEKYVVSEHAAQRLDERGILEWQAVVGLDEGELMAERPHDKPHPAVEVRERLPDGTEVKVVWSLLARSGVAKLVTVHFVDEGQP